MKVIAIYFMVLHSFGNVGFGQIQDKGNIEIGKKISFHSTILNETRELLIYSPKSSTSRKTSYPVIYLFDAESLFIPAVGAINFLNYSSYFPQMPEAYIVGIVNSKRDRDMPMPQEIEKTDGVENFYLFLSQEVVPYINKNFSTSGLNILAGHSQGGLFVTHAALQNPRLFPFVVAMDAPMEVTKSVEEFYSKKLSESCGLKYVSMKRLYGWKNETRANNDCAVFSQIVIENENHETMPYKGLYEGLRYLFNDYWPPAKDLPLQKLQDYYASLEKKYQISYPIPSKVLLESAKQNIGQLRKPIALELLSENDKLYGPGSISSQLLSKANMIVKAPDERVSNALSHPSPSEEEITPFLGKWSGVVEVPGGTNTPIDWEIKKVEGRYLMEADVMRQFKSKSDFLYINEKKELVWGRNHDGGGIYISIGQLSADGLSIKGMEDLIGFEFPANMPSFEKNKFVYHKL